MYKHTNGCMNIAICIWADKQTLPPFNCPYAKILWLHLICVRSLPYLVLGFLQLKVLKMLLEYLPDHTANEPTLNTHRRLLARYKEARNLLPFAQLIQYLFVNGMHILYMYAYMYTCM